MPRRPGGGSHARAAVRGLVFAIFAKKFGCPWRTLSRGRGRVHADSDSTSSTESSSPSILNGAPSSLPEIGSHQSGGIFCAFVRGGADVPAADGGRTSLTASRPRRSVRKKKDGGDGRREAAGDRGGGGEAAKEDDDVRLPEAEAFVRQVRKRAGDAAYASFIAVVRAAGGDRSMDANAIYDGAREALGAAHGDLLGVFAAVYLPGRAEWEEQEARRLAPKRKHAASSFAGAVDDDTRSRAAKNRKPLAGDGNRRPALHDGESSGGGTSTRLHHHEGLDFSWRPQTAGKNIKVQFSRQLEDGCNFADDHKVFPIKAKNGRANGGHRRFVTISVGNEATGSKAEARGKDGGDGGRRHGEKKPCRRATNGEGSGKAVAAAAQGEGHGEVLRFRRMWEFETSYSKLVATMARAEELLHGGGAHAHGARASMEELFPSRECREFLEFVYGEEEWRHMRRALERAGVALETVLQRLGGDGGGRRRGREETRGPHPRRQEAQHGSHGQGGRGEAAAAERRRRWRMNGVNSPAGKLSTSSTNGDDRWTAKLELLRT
ncbi:hypothetical protein ACP70R_033499 [Stipagrostis hirtigluma subsp. patula]